MGKGPFKLNLKFFWKIWISKKLPHKKPTASVEIHILIEFVKQNDNHSIYEADICTDALIGPQDILSKFSEILVHICGHSWVSKMFFTIFDHLFPFWTIFGAGLKTQGVSRILV